jgi:alginate O-acetyltransferase complex protein AlgI
MNFSSISFLFYFLPFVIIVYYLSPRRSFKNGLLLVASLFFYAWGEGALVAILIGSILANHVFAYLIAKNQAGRKRKNIILVAAVSANLALLIVFKYLGFISDMFAGFGVPHIDIALPLGISFFTFQAISLNIDVYRGARAPSSPLKTGLYISLFAQLIAGPIVRFNEIREQINQRTETVDRFVSGMQIFIIGLAQKILLADILAGPADMAFSAIPSELGFGMAWFGLFCFSLQIYYDFAGYSNMAIGIGRVFGFELPQNFNHPYSASSFRDFWRRWHMTLSRWFRDYLYIPLGGSRLGAGRTYVNLLIVFVLCGFWHGAAWTFLLWGLWHGTFLVLERLCPALPIKPSVKSALGTAYVVVFVSLGWVLFRAENLPHALAYWHALLPLNTGQSLVNIGFVDITNTQYLAFAIGAFLAWDGPLKMWKRVHVTTLSVRREFFEAGVIWGSVGGLFLLSSIFLAAQTHQPFLYFRF